MPNAVDLAGVSQPPEISNPGRRLPWSRTAAAVCALFCLLQYAAWEPKVVAPLFVLMLALVSVASVTSRSSGTHTLPIGTWLLVPSGIAGVVALAMKSSLLDMWQPAVFIVPVLMAVGVVLASCAGGRRADAAFGLLLATWTVLALGDLAMVEVIIDVRALLEDSLAATLSGQSPYGITVDNPYTPADTERFYGPGVVENGRVMFGYPYLPAPLLLDVPAYLLGDVRWMHMAAIVGAAVIAWRLATDQLGRACAVFLVVNPLSATVLLAFWVEPILVLLLTLGIVGMLRGRGWTAVALGLFFASKQYAVSYVPALWSVGRSSGWRTVWLAGLVGSLVVGGFVLWDPAAFVHSAIEFHVRQPLRPDSVSLLPAIDELFGSVPDWMLAASPLVGMTVSIALAWRSKPGATAFALGVGLSLLVTCLISKQAHMNYFFLAGVSLLLAVVIWPRDDPIPERRT